MGIDQIIPSLVTNNGRFAGRIIGPYAVPIDITNKCNLRCLHCYNASGENYTKNNEMTDEFILNELTEQLIEISPEMVCLCGGEPLVRLDLISKFIPKLHNANINHINMVSNGLFINEDTIDQIEELKLSMIQISLDGFKDAHDKLRNHDGAFEKTVKAIKLLNKRGVLVDLCMCPTVYNYYTLEDFYSYLNDNFEYRGLRIQPLMGIGRGRDNPSLFCSNEQYSILINSIRKINTNVFYSSRQHMIEWGDPIDHLIRFRNMDDFVPYLSISASGAIFISNYIPIEFGNIKRHTLKEYWDSGLYRLWKLPLVKEMTKNILSMKDLSDYQEIDYYKNLRSLDIIDNKINII